MYKNEACVLHNLQALLNPSHFKALLEAGSLSSCSSEGI